jgi:hypothetical protein
MIEFACFCLLLALVVIRGPKAISSGVARPAWIATGVGMLSLATYGTIVPASALDEALGDSNLLTLARDLCATSAFWFFREAVGGYAGVATRSKPSDLFSMLFSYALPFFWIADRNHFSVSFIENRIDQLPVWLYGTTYMFTIGWLSYTTIRLARKRRTRTGVVFSVGYTLVVLSCAIEIAYLSLAHLDIGGAEFRHSMYYLSESPFFTGILIIVVGIAGITFGGRIRNLQLKHRATQARLKRILGHHSGEAAANSRPSAGTPRDRAYEMLLAVESLESEGHVALQRREKAWLSAAQRLMALPGAPNLIEVGALSAQSKPETNLESTES